MTENTPPEVSFGSKAISVLSATFGLVTGPLINGIVEMADKKSEQRTNTTSFLKGAFAATSSLVGGFIGLSAGIVASGLAVATMVAVGLDNIIGQEIATAIAAGTTAATTGLGWFAGAYKGAEFGNKKGEEWAREQDTKHDSLVRQTGRVPSVSRGLSVA